MGSAGAHVYLIGTGNAERSYIKLAWAASEIPLSCGGGGMTRAKEGRESQGSTQARVAK